MCFFKPAAQLTLLIFLTGVPWAHGSSGDEAGADRAVSAHGAPDDSGPYRYRLTRASVLSARPAGVTEEGESPNSSEAVDLRLPCDLIVAEAACSAGRVAVPPTAVATWEESQRVLAYLASRYGEVEVISGAHYGIRLRRIMDKQSPPDTLYHAVYLPSRGATFAIVIATDPAAPQTLYSGGMVSLIELERITGERFFSDLNLPASIKDSRYVSRSQYAE